MITLQGQFKTLILKYDNIFLNYWQSFIFWYFVKQIVSYYFLSILEMEYIDISC